VWLPAPAPPEIRVSAQFQVEDGGAWVSVPELDISAEGDDPAAALRNVISAIREWLSYVRDERPDLAEELQGQARYVPLLDAPEFSWFKSIALN